MRRSAQVRACRTGCRELAGIEHLELYLGTDDYGWDGSIDDVLPLLADDRFPRLKYLGLRDSEIADGVAQAVAKSPLLEKLDVLDLSLGTLGDEGAAARCSRLPR